MFSHNTSYHNTSSHNTSHRCVVSLLTTKDVIGSMFALVQHVGELGVRIHTVRNVETIANM